MSADLLRRAAARLRDPYLCNTNAYTPALADWLDAEARAYEIHAGSRRAVGEVRIEIPATTLAAREVARQIVGEQP